MRPMSYIHATLFIMKTIALGIVAIMVVIVGYFLVLQIWGLSVMEGDDIDSTPQPMVLEGTYLCLPHLDTSGPQTEECAFGIQADTGEFYAVNFGASADAMQQFQANARIHAEGFFVPKEALSTDQWQKYDMVGIFTVTQMLEAEPSAPQGKIDIRMVCSGALAYMTFPSSAEADAFVAECIEGKHPEVIDEWKERMGIDNLQAI